MEKSNLGLYKNITNIQEFDKYTLMLTDVPSHAMEGKFSFLKKTFE